MTQHRGHRLRFLLSMIAGAGALLCCGCQTLTFYSQAVAGQWAIVTKRKSIEKLIDSPSTAPELQRQLRLIQSLRAFAETNLNLPAEGQFTRYVDLNCPFVVWNVEATPAYSLDSKTWWYPFVGSQEYRGYFKFNLATNYAGRLNEQNMDVLVGGVEAYSTLGWFNDPVLSTFVYRDEADLADLIFHELTHQKIYVSGDTDFNEAFATLVARVGVRRWFEARHDPASLDRFLVARQRKDRIIRLILSARDRLKDLYADESRYDFATMKSLKAGIIDQLRSDYWQLTADWPDYHEYDNFMKGDINNAWLNAVDTYHHLVPYLQTLLDQEGGDLPAFYEVVQAMKHWTKEERRDFLGVPE